MKKQKTKQNSRANETIKQNQINKNKIKHLTRKMKRRNWFQGIKTQSWVPKWP